LLSLLLLLLLFGFVSERILMLLTT
jgi:hypothetical protein